jgi:hypothetical protein
MMSVQAQDVTTGSADSGSEQELIRDVHLHFCTLRSGIDRLLRTALEQTLPFETRARATSRLAIVSRLAAALEKLDRS